MLNIQKYNEAGGFTWTERSVVVDNHVPRPTTTVEGVVGVDTLLLATSVIVETLVRVC